MNIIQESCGEEELRELEIYLAKSNHWLYLYCTKYLLFSDKYVT
jgi:hypothetical protein